MPPATVPDHPLLNDWRLPVGAYKKGACGERGWDFRQGSPRRCRLSRREDFPLSATDKSGAPGAPVPLSPVDHAWLRMDEPSNLMIINGVLVLGAPLAREHIRRILAQRLLPISRFHQRIVMKDGDPFWEEVPAVDLDDHLVEVTLPGPGG